MREHRLFIRIELTDSAKARATAAGIDVNSATQSLDASVQIGDRVSFGGGDPADDFMVLRRRHLVSTGPAILLLVLDHPARN